VTRTHLIGLLLGTEDDWPTAFEQYLARLAPRIEHGGDTHEVTTERVTIEPFDLRQPVRHSLVIDRLAYWYDHPREWLKKIALMDRAYLLNNPFTFQSMEKHAGYCAAIRLGFDVPATWLLPHKVPPENERFAPTAARYNRAFDLASVGERVGYPMYMKPFHGGGWVNVYRIGDPDELQRAYDASGRELMHLQAGVEGYDIFTRGLAIGPQTMVMHYDPTRPLHLRYQVDHEFLTAELGNEIVTFGKSIGAFFRWEFNSFEVIVRDGRTYPIDFANATPDMAIISLHYYFPWAITALAKWSLYCVVTRRRRGRRSWRPTGGWSTTTTRPTASASSASATWATPRSAWPGTSTAPSSTPTWSPPSGGRSRRTSTSSSSPTTAACSAPGSTTSGLPRTNHDRRMVLTATLSRRVRYA
jgi:hypothetical protein